MANVLPDYGAPASLRQLLASVAMTDECTVTFEQITTGMKRLGHGMAASFTAVDEVLSSGIAVIDVPLSAIGAGSLIRPFAPSQRRIECDVIAKIMGRDGSDVRSTGPARLISWLLYEPQDDVEDWRYNMPYREREDMELHRPSGCRVPWGPLRSDEQMHLLCRFDQQGHLNGWSQVVRPVASFSDQDDLVAT